MALLAVVLTMLTANLASAQSTLDKIIAARTIRVSIDVANAPFGILDRNDQLMDRTSQSRASSQKT